MFDLCFDFIQKYKDQDKDLVLAIMDILINMVQIGILNKLKNKTFNKL